MNYDDPVHRDVSEPAPEAGSGRVTRPPPLRPLPSAVGAWHFCVPARPVPSVAGDPAWLSYLGVEPADAATGDEPWVEYLRR